MTLKIGQKYPDVGQLLEDMPRNSGVLAVELFGGGLSVVRFTHDIHTPYGKNLWECAKIGGRKICKGRGLVELTKLPGEAKGIGDGTAETGKLASAAL